MSAIRLCSPAATSEILLVRLVAKNKIREAAKAAILARVESTVGATGLADQATGKRALAQIHLIYQAGLDNVERIYQPTPPAAPQMHRSQ
jgi:hypothetical protein